ncbi:hypothetical protein ACQCN2_04830 [Brevibacillus ginsengisoli]|uniref:hypothetical protein n=1 Tax=Brevibacillus ginsengisoli TaxID=363854 RepID=UPI003CF1CD19
MECQLTTAHYRAILRKFTQEGFSFIDYHEATSRMNEKKKVVLLRHDIDQSVNYAHKMACLEAEEGAKSTYFVWLSSPFYNVWNKQVLDRLKEIKKMGHQLGLHFEMNENSLSEEALSNLICNEVQCLSRAIDEPVTVFSFHRPSEFLLKSNLQIDGLINAYGQLYMKEFKYLSDSNHCWREDCVCNHITSYPKLHVLTHPIWWVFGEENDPIKKISQFIAEKDRELKSMLIDNIEGYKNYSFRNVWK